MYDLHLSNTLHVIHWIPKKQRGSLVWWCQPGLQQQDVSKNKTKQNKNEKTTRNLQQLMDAQTQAGEARSTGPSALANADCIINNFSI